MTADEFVFRVTIGLGKYRSKFGTDPDMIAVDINTLKNLLASPPTLFVPGPPAGWRNTALLPAISDYKGVPLTFSMNPNYICRIRNDNIKHNGKSVYITF